MRNNLYNTMTKKVRKEREMKELTKERLIELGVTDVTEDGEVFVNNAPAKVYVSTCKHKNGRNKDYPTVHFYDTSVKRYYTHNYTTKSGEKKKYKWYTFKSIRIPLGRLVFAWFNGSIKEDCDHIDNDPFNNHISNLREITRKMNLKKRFTDHPEYKGYYFNQYMNLINQDN